MKTVKIMSATIILFLCFTSVACAIRPVPIIPMRVTEEINVFLRELDINKSLVGSYIDLLAQNDATARTSEERTKLSAIVKKASADYMNSSIIPLIQNAITRSGTFWKIRGVLPAGGKDKIKWNDIGNLNHNAFTNALKEMDHSFDTYVVFEPSLSIVSGLRKFSGSFGFIINRFLEFEKSKEWVYLTLNLKAEVHHKQGNKLDIFNDFIMVPLAKWKRSKINVGIDKRILAIALSQISATGIVQEALNIFTDELKKENGKSLANIGFELVSSVVDPVQAISLAIYQSAYRITERLNIQRPFEQAVVDNMVENVKINGMEGKAHLLIVDGFDVYIPDPLDLSESSTKFRIVETQNVSNGKERKVFWGEIYIAQPFRLSRDYKSLKKMLLQKYDLSEDNFKEDFGRKNLDDIVSSLKQGIRKDAMLANENYRKALIPLAKKKHNDKDRLETAKKNKDLSAIKEINEEIKTDDEKIRTIKKKYQFLFDLLYKSNYLVIKLDGSVNDKTISEINNGSWVAEIAWEWYIHQYKEK